MVTGRPHASSREAISEAASELFLERGFAQVSVGDIAARAGVSRSSFFNYFSSKTDVVWAGFDAQISALEERLAAGDDVAAALLGMAADFRPDALALACTNRAAMGLTEELERDTALRTRRIARAVAGRLERDGCGPLEADVRGGALAAAVLAAVDEWVRRGVGTTAFADVLREALDAARAAGAA
jgi:AcrR family transcriptional regulator